jgi:hypothetical protein
MTSQKTAAILTIVGGVFYIIGGALVAGALDLLGSSSNLFGSSSGLFNPCSITGPFACDSNATIPGSGLGFLTGGGLDTGAVADAFLAIGLITGFLIILGGWFFNSPLPGRRKVGGIIAIVGVLVGGLTTFGGVVIGFILACIGIYLGLTYRSSGRPLVIGLGPVGSVTLGPQGAGVGSSDAPAGTGPLNYCIKCGSQIRPGSVFCGACGARLLD